MNHRSVFLTIVASTIICLSLIISKNATQAKAPLTDPTPIKATSTITKQEIFTPAGNQPLEEVGRIGGDAAQVSIYENLAFVVSGVRVVILDISNPAAPNILGQTDSIFSFITTIAASENYLYIATTAQELIAYDVSDPTNPVQTTLLTFTYLYSIEAASYIAYVLADEGLHIYDMTVPGVPTEVGFYGILPWSNDFALSTDQHIFLTEYVSGNIALVALDISNPSNPVEADTLDMGPLYGIEEVEISGNNVYVLNQDGEEAVHIYDISNPNDLQASGVYELTVGATIWDIFASGNYLFIAAYWAGVRIIDVSSPLGPFEIAEVDSGYLSFFVTATENYVYVTDSGRGVRIFDVSQPLNPVEVGAYNPLGESLAFALQESYAYIYDNGDGLRTIDISDPYNMSEVGLYDFSNYSEGVRVGVAAKGMFVYNANYGEFLKINVSDPSKPFFAGELNEAGRSVALSDTYAYVATRDDGLLVIDISGNPILVGAYNTESPINVVRLSENYAYILEHPLCTPLCKGSSGLRILDLNNPANPTNIGFFEFPPNSEGEFSQLNGLLIKDNFAYISESCTGLSDCQNRLHILDISDPANPIKISASTLPDYHNYISHGIDLAWGYAFVVFRGGLSVIDVSNPVNPARLAGYPNFGGYDVAIQGNYVFIVGAGLSAFEANFQTTEIISNQGGTLHAMFDNTLYTFPEAAFNEATNVNHIFRVPFSQPKPLNMTSINHDFEVKAVDSEGNPTDIAQPYTITIQYTNEELGGAIESTLALYYWNGSQWVKETTSQLNMATNTITAMPDHLGRWAIIGETNQIHLPVIINGTSNE